jgi:hypothetical protein
MVLGAVFEAFDLTAAALAAVLVTFVYIELGSPYTWLVWLCTTLTTFLFYQHSPMWFFYFILFGIYPILKGYIERLPRIAWWVLKLIYGNIAPQSVGAILRALLRLEDEGGNIFFGEPDLELADWIEWAEDGRGMMNILECQELFQHPLLYGTFLLWMLSEIYEMLPEAGDLDKPKLVFFFDEAHLLFKDAPKALVEKVEQVVRLIRSKGVSVWFITQNPSDIPESVLGQIGNRVQHALRAYTPNEQKYVRAAAKSFRENPAFDTEEALQALGVGEALVSVLNSDGIPTVVERANILPPHSSMKAVEGYAIQSIIDSSALKGKYSASEDQESAYEILQGEAEEAAKEAQEAAEAIQAEKERKAQEKLDKERAKQEEKERKEKERRRKNSILGKVTSSAVNTIGREVGRRLVRGILDTLLK